jgi:hypothetical protein
LGIFNSFKIAEGELPMTSRDPETDADDDRRKFLATCGKFAVVTPPAITLLLSTSLHSDAIAKTGGSDDKDKDKDK